MKYSPANERALMTELWDPTLADDLYRWVMFAYPWGKVGTPLEHDKGPRTWQREDLEEMTDHLRQNKERIARGEQPVMWRKATASGRGPGKTAFISWIADWMVTTKIGSTTIIAANTELQLKTRTFAEIKRWTTMLINAHWFESTVLTVAPAPWFRKLLEDQLKIDCQQYYVAGQLWSEENPDAFAGAHNQYGMCLQMDEASGIPNKIFDVSEGFFARPILHRYWNVYSNPRRNSGAFHDTFKMHSAFWRLRHLDSRTVEGIDLAHFDRMIQQYGIDSDTVRVEILGQFPKTGKKQFISNEAVYGAQQRELVDDPGAPLIIGYDPARFGDDDNKVRFRQGRDARSIPPQTWKGLDNVESAEKIAEIIDFYNPDAVFIDSGAGGGIIDILKHRGYRVNEVSFGSSKGIDDQWANKRTAMYAELRDWLPGGCIDGSQELFGDLTSVDYDFYGKSQEKQILESKEILKGKIGRSPGDGDALALTFGGKVARRDINASRFKRSRRSQSEEEYAFGE